MGNNHNSNSMWGEHSIMAGDRTFEYTTSDISIMGLILIALVSMIQIIITSLYVVIPIISVLILGLLIKYIKDLRK